jgi:hypothetical protein
MATALLKELDGGLANQTAALVTDGGERTVFAPALGVAGALARVPGASSQAARADYGSKRKDV